MKTDKINLVVFLIKSTNIDLDYCSPNFIADIAYNNNINLTSKEIVYISNNIENLIINL